MKYFKNKTWLIVHVVMIAIIFSLVVNHVLIYKQNNDLKEEIVNYINAEWYQLYHLCENIDKHYINNNFENGEEFRLYLNQVCYHFAMTGKPTELSVNMRYFLTLAYDPLFADLCMDENTQDKEQAKEIFKSMTEELMAISKDVLDMENKETLLDTRSVEFININERVKNATDKYLELVDDYFKGY